jgi:putative phosphoribosyl transferase
VPDHTRGLVVFAHDAGSDGRNVGDRYVAACLRDLGFGTLLFDLLAPEESELRDPTIDLDVLAVRLLVVTRWLKAQADAGEHEIAYFGVRAGAAVALLAAAADPSIGAVVARGGRLDLIGRALREVRTPTLLVVGDADRATFVANERADAALTCAHDFKVVPRASELFVEPGALDASARLAGSWFLDHLSTHSQENSSR